MKSLNKNHPLRSKIDNHNYAFSKENPNARKVTYVVEKNEIKLMKWIDEIQIMLYL